MDMISSSSFLSPIPRLLVPSKIAIGGHRIHKKQQPLLCLLGTEEGIVNGRKHGNSGSRRAVLMFTVVSSGLLVALSAHGKAKSRSPYDERRLLEQNRKIQEANRAPDDFPNFVREGFQVKVVASDSYLKSDSGLMYRDVEVGKGDYPKDGQQNLAEICKGLDFLERGWNLEVGHKKSINVDDLMVIFHYVGYNESGRRIDSTYLQGRPAKIRLGNNSLVPGFEEGIKDMKPGGKRRIIIPPELGPPVGPATFFSAKQFEVFDIELLDVQDCERRTIGFYSDVVCK